MARKRKRRVLRRHTNRCDVQAVSDNIRHFLHYGRSGRPVAQRQAVAIALAILKRGCGCGPVRSARRMTPTEIVSQCRK